MQQRDLVMENWSEAIEYRTSMQSASLLSCRPSAWVLMVFDDGKYGVMSHHSNLLGGFLHVSRCLVAGKAVVAEMKARKSPARKLKDRMLVSL
jgi:hypothetical protein